MPELMTQANYAEFIEMHKLLWTTIKDYFNGDPDFYTHKLPHWYGVRVKIKDLKDAALQKIIEYGYDCSCDVADYFTCCDCAYCTFASDLIEQIRVCDTEKPDKDKRVHSWYHSMTGDDVCKYCPVDWEAMVQERGIYACNKGTITPCEDTQYVCSPYSKLCNIEFDVDTVVDDVNKLIDEIINLPVRPLAQIIDQ